MHLNHGRSKTVPIFLFFSESRSLSLIGQPTCFYLATSKSESTQSWMNFKTLVDSEDQSNHVLLWNTISLKRSTIMCTFTLSHHNIL